MSDGSTRPGTEADSQTRQPWRVLCVDDEPDVVEVTATFLDRESERLAPVTATSPTQALDLLATGGIDCVVSDYQMPEMNGLTFLNRVRSEYGDLPFILFTGQGSEEIASDAISDGVTEYLQKTAEPDQYTVLANSVENAIGSYRAERRVAALLHSAPYGLVIVDADGLVQQINDRLEALFGYSRGDLLGEPIDVLVPARCRDGHPLCARWDAGTETGGAVEGASDFWGRRKDGSEFPIEVALAPSAPDNPSEIVASIRDVSAVKSSAQETEFAETLFENTQDALFVVAVDEATDEYRLERINPAYEAHTGLSSDQLRGRTLRDVFGDEEGTGILSRYRECVRKREPLEYEERVSVPAGAFYWETRIAPVIVDGTVQQLVGATRNITERKEHERELTRQNERLEEFAAVVGHDLRNPLTVARGSLELARRSGRGEDFDRTAAAIERMDTLIDDLLTLARQGRVVAETEPVRLAPLVATVWETLDSETATLESTLEDDVVDADRARLQQLLENVLSNAVRHGGDAVTVRVGPLGTDTGFFVADDGDGIPASERQDVFHRGYSTSSAGTGFGLAIVEDIADAHGWTVAATESADGGARFEVTTRP